MGRNKSWYSAIKRLFKPCYTGKPVNGLERKNTTEKKKVRGILRNGDTKSFIPLFREPSSIEKILGEVDQQNLIFKPAISAEKSETPPLVLTGVASPRRLSSAKAASPRASSPRVAPLRITSPRNTSRRATSPRTASPQVTSPRDASRRVTSPRTASPQVTSPRDASRRVTSPRTASPQVNSPRDASQAITSPRGASPEITSQRETSARGVVDQPMEVNYRTEPSTSEQHLSATKIQAVYRGYMARKNFRAFRGLLRLLEVVKGQSVKRQTKNALKTMRTLVQVQTQVQSLRNQMIKNHAIHRQAFKNEKDLESTLNKWNGNQSEADLSEDWDDSFLTKEEKDARLQKKGEAIIKRERTVAYAHSHKMWRANPNQSQTPDTQPNEFPWLWNWLDSHLLPENHPDSQTVKNFYATPPRRTPEQKRSPRPSPKSYKQFNSGFNTPDGGTPTSTRSAIPSRSRSLYTPPNLTPARSSIQLKQPKYRPSTPFDAALNDTDSLTSCPAFSGPRYMSPTAAARAKMRDRSSPKDRLSVSPTPSRRRFSFPLTPDNASSKWNKGKESCSASTISMSSTVGRKPFNRFV